MKLCSCIHPLDKHAQYVLPGNIVYMILLGCELCNCSNIVKLVDLQGVSEDKDIPVNGK